LGNESDDINNQSGDGFEKLHADAPPRANAQKVPNEMSLTGL